MVKEAIARERTEFVADKQKLIHAGKVLKDNSTIGESGINENEFIVCMITKEPAKVMAKFRDNFFASNY